MFKKLSDEKTSVVESQISLKWESMDILKKSLENKKNTFVFYDGPATANGFPGLHHMVAKFLKDSFCKYKTMQGNKVLRKVGWDTHGLPVEVEVEKTLGFTSKNDIEKYGIKEFNEKCREIVWKNEKAFSDLTTKMGQFIDLKNPYVTYDNNYIETEWYILKKFFDEGLFYEGVKIVPFCTRCGTGLASHEVAQGYKEITLLGQNVNSYLRSGKKNFESDIKSFADLLRAVNQIDGIERIRFVSPHPKDFTDDVIEAIRDCEKVSKIVHLPLQSGSTQILKVMNRKYTKEQFLSLAEKMKKMIPEVVFSTDIIVGFPGETEEDFEDTLDVVRQVKFEQVFMFIYSRRVGTPGDRMENQVPEEIKHERFNRLKELVESQIAENNQKYIGTIQKVLVEGVSKTNNSILTGRTDSNKVVNFEGCEEMIGNMVDLKIVSEHMWYLKGEIC